MLNGVTLRDLRRRVGVTQVDLARRVGIPSTVVSAYECGRRQPSLEVAGRIIAALGYEVRFESSRRRALDPKVQARKLVDVLLLAEAQPYRPRPMSKARLR